MIINSIKIQKNALEDQIAVVTGGGGGIGFETAKCMLALGAKVIIGEVDSAKCDLSRALLSKEFDNSDFDVIELDVGSEESVDSLSSLLKNKYDRVDIIVNNATIAPMGYVWDVPIADWDESYAVNLRGPVLMARTFIPDMRKRNSGTFICVSSTGTTFLGAYETFKAAQVHLADTLADELEGTKVNVLTIGPGLVMTETATRSVEMLAPRMGMTLDQFYELNKDVILSIEEAAVGFTLAAVFAEKYRGLEISSSQVLSDAGYRFNSSGDSHSISSGDFEKVGATLQKIYRTLLEQSDGWKQRSVFERQWMLRDFKKVTGEPVENWLSWLKDKQTGTKDFLVGDVEKLNILISYYRHMADLAKGYEKDKMKLSDSLNHIEGWIRDIEELVAILK